MFPRVPCGIAGTIPVSIGNLTELTYLDLEYNALTGPFACLVESHQRNHSLVSPRAGAVPASIGNLTNLQSLELQRNALTGPRSTRQAHVGILFQKAIARTGTKEEREAELKRLLPGCREIYA